MTERLITLEALKKFLGIDTDSSDQLLMLVLNAASQFALNYMNRDSMGAREYTENFRGNGKDTTLLRNWPVLSVTSVGIAGSFIPASVIGTAGLPGSGYTISDPRSAPQSINLYGHHFYYRAPSQVVYRAGYEATQSFVLVVADSKIEVTTSVGGQWIYDVGVTIDGVVATKVDATPAAGEYSVSEWGVYTFNVADAGKTAVITFAYAPYDISLGVLEMAGEWWKRRDRLGVLSKNLGGQEAVTFSTAEMSDAVRAYLQPYRNVIPV